MKNDLRHAMRMLLHAKGWTAVVALSLALGIGANTALFSAVNELLLMELPVRDPDTLVRLRWTGRNDAVTDSSDYGFSRSPDGQEVRATFSYPMYRQFVADNRTMTDMLACAPLGRVSLVVDGQAEIASASIASGNYYTLLGVAARIGRTLLPEDDRPTAPPVAVISSRYWRSRFAGSRDVVGQVVKVNGVAVTIVGVIPRRFTGVQQPVDDPPDISVPLALDPQLNTEGGPPRLNQPTYWWLQVMGRLAPGVTVAQVQGNLEGTFQHTAREGLASYLGSLSEAERGEADNQTRTEVPRLRVEPGSRGIYDVETDLLRLLTILGVVVALVLLIVCANVANMLLSRAMTRERELSVRLSLGATRARLIRQLLIESLLLAALGGALGILVAYWGRTLLPFPAMALDWRMLGFVLVATGTTGILFGIAPALRATGASPGAALKGASRGIVGRRSRLGKSLLVVQVAISLVLLVGAGLFLRTLHNLRNVDVGFDPHDLLLFQVTPELNRYDETRATTLYREILERVGAIAGVRGVALSRPALLSGSVNTTRIFVQGRSYPQDRDSGHSVHRLVVSPSFFGVMGIPVLAGRGFTEHDDDRGPRVALLNEAAARTYFPDGSPLGQRVGSSLESAGQIEIVGVLRDVRYNSVREDVPPTLYVPFLQTRIRSAAFEVRTGSAFTSVVGAIRETMRQIDADLPLVDVSTQVEQIERRFRQERLLAWMYAAFGGVALLVAAVGLFGLMSYSVARRTGEIGIRMALGARRQDVLRMVLRESMVLVVTGVVLGLALAAAAGRLIATLLFGLAPTDVPSIALATGLLIVVAAVAGYIPARRASRVDPLVALRYE